MSIHVNITLPALQMLPAGPPGTYLGRAYSLACGIDPLFAASGCEPVLTFVCGQVTECALKAILTQDGDDKRVRGKLRHDLVGLWELALSEGFQLEAPPPAWLRALDHVHGGPDYFIRYSTKVHGLSYPIPSDMVNGVKAVLVLAARPRG
jgi:hypothetical protein